MAVFGGVYFLCILFMNYQKIILVGRATRNGEVLESKKGKRFGKFGLAVNRYMGKDKESEACFYDVLVFGKSAEKVADKIKTGEPVVVIGRPEAEGYNNKKGDAVAKLVVVAESWNTLN
jgi:single-strand DNA-binding protein